MASTREGLEDTEKRGQKKVLITHNWHEWLRKPVVTFPGRCGWTEPAGLRGISDLGSNYKGISARADFEWFRHGRRYEDVRRSPIALQSTTSSPRLTQTLPGPVNQETKVQQTRRGEDQEFKESG